ncbi:MAG: bifunctional phosphopantothenoylcysteine decarboxylase/phosphopantothenate--cysteine ligase CoaBC [Flavobacteriales bacterium]|nr:bifunctional phosphopantothenoylcysteine decarboxylase/phosphopantothenate--cysteine ligase CoaBC [Flavobacteriales bacterium]MDG1765805.1 bifunctional phosphopantothenoylcysteine decarboxylase/phosphopantothenate--cysteine ligase CoaBC [Flavobacteriales bacterium]
MLKGKKIILAITGSIAAYKAAELLRAFVKRGAEVRVVLTKSAHDFVTPLTLATLSQHRVYSDFTEDEDQGTWTNHVDLGLWADLMIVAPATANTIAKMSQGICDEFLLAVYLSAKCPIAIAPAMDLDMYAHESTQNNLQILEERGHLLIDSESGFLASGLEGKGRMAEPENIVKAIDEFFNSKAPLRGKKCLVTAGPTYEKIDAVRFIGNYSSGKMGFAIADQLASMGAEVVLVSGPSSEQVQQENITRIDVESAAEMLEACLIHFPGCDILVKSAAVADYKPKHRADIKLKKQDQDLSIELSPTVDILARLGEMKKAHQITIGFALETNNELEHAKSKIQRKNLDLIVLNSLQDTGAGFGHSTNKVTFIDKHNKIANFELKSKRDVALDLSKKILELCS